MRKKVNDRMTVSGRTATVAVRAKAAPPEYERAFDLVTVRLIEME